MGLRNEASYWSASLGAGRRMSRRKAQRDLVEVVARLTTLLCVKG